MIDLDVLSLLKKVMANSDSKLSDLQKRLTVIYNDWTMESEFCNGPLGELSNPLSIENVRRKYVSLALPVLGEE
jgi:hypothetical protein